MTIMIIIYIYHALIDALSAHVIRINQNTIFYTDVGTVLATNAVYMLFEAKTKCNEFSPRIHT